MKQPQYVGNLMPVGLEPQASHEERGFGEQLVDGMQAYSWVKPYLVETMGDTQDVVDPYFDPREAERFGELKGLDPDSYKTIIGAGNEAEFNRLLENQKLSEEAAFRLSTEGASGMVAGFMGGVLSPETFIPVAGVASRLTTVAKVVNFASKSKKYKAALVAKDTALNMATYGAVAGLRAEVDTTYNMEDAAFDTVMTGMFTVLGESIGMASRSKLGRTLREQQQTADRLRADLEINKKAQVSAQAAKGEMEVELGGTQKKVKRLESATEIPSASTLPFHELSNNELKKMRSKRLKGGQAEEVNAWLGKAYADADKLKKVREAADLEATEVTEASTPIKQKPSPEERKLLSEIKSNETKLGEHNASIEAEIALINRQNGLPENTPLDGWGEAYRNKAAKSLSEAIEVVAKQAEVRRMEEVSEGFKYEPSRKPDAIEQASTDETRLAFYEEYVNKYKTKEKEQKKFLAINKKKVEKLHKEREALHEDLRKRSVTQREQLRTKPRKMTTAFFDYMSDHGRAMRSGNEAYIELMDKLLQSSRYGGTSAATVAATNLEDMVGLLSRSVSRKDLKDYLRELRQVNPRADMDTVFEQISDMVEDIEIPKKGSAAERLRDSFREFYADALERQKVYNPSITTKNSKVYQRRLINHNVVYKLANEGADEAVVQAIYNGIRKAQREELLSKMTEEEAEAIMLEGASGYWRRIKKVSGWDDSDKPLNALNAMESPVLDDMTLDELGANIESIGRTVGADKPSGGKNGAGFLKSRLRIRLDAQSEDGSIDLRDLFERNALRAAQRYAAESSAWMGFNSQGIYNTADLDKYFKRIRRGGKTNKQGSEQLDRAMKHVAKLRGIPIYSDSMTNNGAHALMAYSYISKMGGAFVMAAAEWSRSTAMLGYQAFRHAPFLSDPVKMIGKLKKEELFQMGDDIQSIMPHQNQVSLLFSGMDDLEDLQMSGKVAAKMRYAADAMGRVNLMEQVDRRTRGAAIDIYHNRLVGALLGDDDLPTLLNADYIGLTAEKHMRLRTLMQKTAKRVKGDFGYVYNVDFKKWTMRERLDYKEMLTIAGRRLVQKSFAGEEIKGLASPLQRIFLQFRGFGLTAINKQFGADLTAAAQAGLHGYVSMMGAWSIMGAFTVLGIEARKAIFSVGTGEDIEFKPDVEADWATWWRYHPSLGWTRDMVDLVGGTVENLTPLERGTIGEYMGTARRSSSWGNEGIIESTAVGTMVTKDIPNLADDPSLNNISKLLPDSPWTRIGVNTLSSD